MDPNLLRDQETNKLFRICKTVTQMLIDRNYVGEILSREAFEDQIKKGATPRDGMTILTFHNDNPDSKIFVFFNDSPKFKKDELTMKVQLMKNKGANRAIFVLKGDSQINPSEYEAELIFEFFKEEELLVNITQHELVPKHQLISDEEKKALTKRYKVKETQLPKILPTDPIAKYYGLRKGNVVKIIRTSETAGKYITYRIVS